MYRYICDFCGAHYARPVAMRACGVCGQSYESGWFFATGMPPARVLSLDEARQRHARGIMASASGRRERVAVWRHSEAVARAALPVA
jgi:hypothetical protein